MKNQTSFNLASGKNLPILVDIGDVEGLKPYIDLFENKYPSYHDDSCNTLFLHSQVTPEEAKFGWGFSEVVIKDDTLYLLRFFTIVDEVAHSIDATLALKDKYFLDLSGKRHSYWENEVSRAKLIFLIKRSANKMHDESVIHASLMDMDIKDDMYESLLKFLRAVSLQISGIMIDERDE